MKPKNHFVYLVKRVGSEFYWDNYGIARFENLEEAKDYSAYLATVGVETEILNLRFNPPHRAL